ncbi:transposase family protein [Streptomyces sp. NBC_01537]|uniref:transposase family protein n=1 Tax=Streptomyces sp. NBC_01537 TaxID=2903896 RepID=UPI00386E003F
MVTFRARSCSGSARCPGCGIPSWRVHGRYVRRLADAPLGGDRAGGAPLRVPQRALSGSDVGSSSVLGRWRAARLAARSETRPAIAQCVSAWSWRRPVQRCKGRH